MSCWSRIGPWSLMVFIFRSYKSAKKCILLSFFGWQKAVQVLCLLCWYKIPISCPQSSHLLNFGTNFCKTWYVFWLMTFSVSFKRILWFTSLRNGSTSSGAVTKTSGNSLAKSSILVKVAADLDCNIISMQVIQMPVLPKWIVPLSQWTTALYRNKNSIPKYASYLSRLVTRNSMSTRAVASWFTIVCNPLSAKLRVKFSQVTWLVSGMSG